MEGFIEKVVVAVVKKVEENVKVEEMAVEDLKKVTRMGEEIIKNEERIVVDFIKKLAWMVVCGGCQECGGDSGEDCQEGGWDGG